MLETLTKNIETVQAVLSTMAVAPFIMVITSLFKDRLSIYTPYIATAIGIIVGLATSLTFSGVSVISVLVGIIFGTLAGASAVGIKVIADGDTPKKEATGLIEKLEAMKVEE